VPFTRGHWEAAHLARHVPLARGLGDAAGPQYNGLFFAATLDPDAYERWLRRNAVRCVAVPDVPLDPAGRQEAALARSGASFLRPVWRDEHWQVFAVRDPLPLVSGAARLEAFTPQGFTVRAERPGSILVRTRHTPVLADLGAAACVAPAPGGWTRIRALEAGRITVRARFAPGRLAAAGPACDRPAGATAA
jgi:hypothetical protein